MCCTSLACMRTCNAEPEPTLRPPLLHAALCAAAALGLAAPFVGVLAAQERTVVRAQALSAAPHAFEVDGARSARHSSNDAFAVDVAVNLKPPTYSTSTPASASPGGRCCPRVCAPARVLQPEACVLVPARAAIMDHRRVCACCSAESRMLCLRSCRRRRHLPGCTLAVRCLADVSVPGARSYDRDCVLLEFLPHV